MVRGTVAMMCSIAKQNGKQYPSNGDLEEMSKALVTKYEILKDGTTGHVSYLSLHLGKAN